MAAATPERIAAAHAYVESLSKGAKRGYARKWMKFVLGEELRRPHCGMLTTWHVELIQYEIAEILNAQPESSNTNGG